MLKEQVNQAGKKFGLPDTLKYFDTWDRDTMAQNLQQTIIVKGNSRCFHDFLHGCAKIRSQFNNHRLALQSLQVLLCSLWAELINVKWWEWVVVDEADKKITCGKRMSMIGTLQQPHHRGNTLLPYNHLHHLFPVHDQVILLNGLHQYTTQILNDCGTI